MIISQKRLTDMALMFIFVACIVRKPIDAVIRVIRLMSAGSSACQ